MIEETNKWGKKSYRHTTRYSHEVYTRIQNLSRRNHVPFNQMVNHLLSERLGVRVSLGLEEGFKLISHFVIHPLFSNVSVFV